MVLILPLGNYTTNNTYKFNCILGPNSKGPSTTYLLKES